MCAARVTLVLDTSSLLADLNFIKGVASLAETYGTELLIPEQTVRELDKVKDRKPFQETGAARAAINWINEILNSQDPRNDYNLLRGQKPIEITRSNLKADDAILDCAVYNLKYTSRFTILLSNDINLCNRAVIVGVETANIRAGVTPQILFNAIAQRGETQMEYETLQSSQEPQSEHIQAQHQPKLQGRSEDMDNEMDWDIVLEPTIAAPQSVEPDEPVTEPVEHKPSPNRSAPIQSKYSVPRPQHCGNVEERITKSLYKLVDWQIHSVFDNGDLQLLKYNGPPRTPRQLGITLKRLDECFRGVVPQQLLKRLRESTRSPGPEFMKTQAEVLLKLSRNDREYKQLVSEL